MKCNKCKTCYRLIFIGNDNLRFLNAISPFVHIKKERVEVALEFISTLQEKTQKGIKRKCGKIPYGVQEKRYQLYCEMLRFNSKGNSHIVPRWSLPDPILIPKCLICNRTIKIRNRKRIGHTSLCKICYLSHYAGRYRRSGKLSSNAPSLIAY